MINNLPIKQITIAYLHGLMFFIFILDFNFEKKNK